MGDSSPFKIRRVLPPRSSCGFMLRPVSTRCPSAAGAIRGGDARGLSARAWEKRSLRLIRGVQPLDVAAELAALRHDQLAIPNGAGNATGTVHDQARARR